MEAHRIRESKEQIMEDKMIYDKNGEIQLSLISTNKNRRTVLICLFKRQHKIHVDEFLTSQLKYYLDTRNSNDPKKWNIDLYHQGCPIHLKG